MVVDCIELGILPDSSGCGTFLPDGEEPMYLEAGDAILFHRGTVGRWVVRETLRRITLDFPRT
ncbi:cupin domain-containing protein [Mesorhizobium sp. M0184]|uniref:cupin domain-containing protein n=1 Tax=Mesorhizobium sp. M0184 TaxID=2956906 RepID=UPI003336D1B9